MTEAEIKARLDKIETDIRDLEKRVGALEAKEGGA